MHLQVRFGARSGAAPILLGVIKVLLGLLFGSSLFQLLKAFPQPLLGSLLIFAGMPLSLKFSQMMNLVSLNVSYILVLHMVYTSGNLIAQKSF